jgi:hypothetical protein
VDGFAKKASRISDIVSKSPSAVSMELGAFKGWPTTAAVHQQVYTGHIRQL